MGGYCSTEYYFGFINISFSHLDILSFMLGFGFAIGIQYIWNYCKHTKRASNHILGKSKKNCGTMEMQAATASQPASCYPYPMTSPFPPYPGVMQATAPPAQGTAVVPWKYSNNAA